MRREGSELSPSFSVSLPTVTQSSFSRVLGSLSSSRDVQISRGFSLREHRSRLEAKEEEKRSSPPPPLSPSLLFSLSQISWLEARLSAYQQYVIHLESGQQTFCGVFSAPLSSSLLNPKRFFSFVSDPLSLSPLSRFQLHHFISSSAGLSLSFWTSLSFTS